MVFHVGDNWACLVAQMVKNLPIKKETWVWSLGQEHLLEWQPTPAFLPGNFFGQRNLVSYSPWGRKKSGMTERLTHENYKKKKERKKYNFGFMWERRVERRKHERREPGWSKREPHCPDTAFASGGFS